MASQVDKQAKVVPAPAGLFPSYPKQGMLWRSTSKPRSCQRQQAYLHGAHAGPEVLSEAPKDREVVVQGPDMRAGLRPSSMTLRQRWGSILKHLLGGSSSLKLLAGIMVQPELGAAGLITAVHCSSGVVGAVVCAELDQPGVWASCV